MAKQSTWNVILTIIGSVSMASVAAGLVWLGGLSERVDTLSNSVSQLDGRVSHLQMGPRSQMCIQLGQELALALRTGDRLQEDRIWESIERLRCPYFEMSAPRNDSDAAPGGFGNAQ